METRQVIDGQQRLTTIQLLLSALSMYISTNSLNSNFNKQVCSFIYNTGTKVHEDSEKYKMWPTNQDREPFKAALAEELQIELDKHNTLHSQAKIYFFERITAWILMNPDYQPDMLAETLLGAITERLLIAVLNLEIDDDALEIFETLNALGTPLLASDLIKNHTLRLFKDSEKEIQSIYNEFYEPFENKKAFWEEEKNVGRFKRRQLDVFYQYLLGIVTGDDVVHENIFYTYKCHLEGKSPAQIKKFLKTIKEYADIYSEMRSSPNKQLQEFLSLMETLEITTVISPVMVVIQLQNEKKEINRILAILESYIVRRSICGMTSKNANRVFHDLTQKLLYGTADSEAVKNFFMSKTDDSTIWPEDSFVKKELMSLPVYKSIKRNRLRRFLMEIDKQMDSSSSIPVVTPHIEIEHIMPKAWEAHWPLPSNQIVVVAATNRNNLINTLGNLTLLTKTLNSSISNGKWKKKRSEITKNNSNNLNREFISQEYEEWNEKLIIKRTEVLTRYFLKRFPR